MRVDLWPLADLRVRTPRLELCYPHDDHLADLADVAAEGIHDPATMPFSVPWTDRPPEQLRLEFLQYHWGVRSRWSAAEWSLPMAVVVDGRPIGVQDVSAKNFAIVREVGTGSWLGRQYHGAGIGREMRAAVLHLAFVGLRCRARAHRGVRGQRCVAGGHAIPGLPPRRRGVARPARAAGADAAVPDVTC